MKYGLENKRYVDGETIPSVSMGDGSVRVSHLLKNDEGFSGVAFSPAPDGTKPGQDTHDTDGYPPGSEVTGMGIYFQLLFDNPVSIDAVISQLEKAKMELSA